MVDRTIIDHKLLQQLAGLAQLRLAADRENLLRERLQHVLGAFAAQRELPTTPEQSPGNCLPLREDEPEPALAVADVLANAPQQAAHCFVVPRMPPP